MSAAAGLRNIITMGNVSEIHHALRHSHTAGELPKRKVVSRPERFQDHYKGKILRIIYEHFHVPAYLILCA